MPQGTQPIYLLASNDPALLAAIEPALLDAGVTPHIVLSAAAALDRLTLPPGPALALLDARLPGMDLNRLLAASAAAPRSFPIVLISDTISEEWNDRLAEAIIDDLVPASIDPRHLLIRLDVAIRFRRQFDELEKLREAVLYRDEHDRLTGAFNREAMLSLLFRETDRVQRMNTSLCLVLFDIDDFGHWNSRLGADPCDDLLIQIAARTQRLLRSYDILGRVGDDEFLAGLPGCTALNAVLLAERMRAEVFANPFHVAGKSVRLSACFAVAASQGRSPVVVLREAEEALALAKRSGPETIQCAGECPQAAPVEFLSPSSGDDLLAW
jgi:diguanylate cyclase (GGDEF)-like protein